MSVKSATTAKEVIVANLMIMKKYVKEVENFTGLKIPDVQMTKLKDVIKTREFKKLSPTEIEIHRSNFKSKLVNLREQWSLNTGQPWPVYKTHPDHRRIGKPLDAHHIIPVSHGGPNEC